MLITIKNINCQHYSTYNITMRRVRATIVAVEQKEVVHIVGMCL
jgi:hypothetical protein